MANKQSDASFFTRLTRIFRSGPVVRRKISTADTLIAVPDRSTSSGALLFQRSQSPTYATITGNAYNLSERLMRYQDFATMEYCLTGDTQIAVPGGFKTLLELSQECEGKPEHTFVVYSYDHNLKCIVPAYGKQARQTRVDHAWKVTFDSGKTITGSANHRLMLRDGTYCKIEDLQIGMAMMPFDENNVARMTPIRYTFQQIKNITLDEVINVLHRSSTINDVCLALEIQHQTLLTFLRSCGFNDFNTFAKTYMAISLPITNITPNIVNVEYVGEVPLYDLTVDGYKNFSTDSVVSHNTPELASALDIYSSEIMPQDEKGRTLHVYSENEKVKEILEDLFYNVLNIDFNGGPWARNLVKYGDFFLYIDVSPQYGVINAFPAPVNEIEREEGYDRDNPFAVRFRWNSLGNRTLENWEIAHFRIMGNDLFLPYGCSIIEPARRIWRQLILIEDAMLVYRITRAPERRIFYIDVGNLPADEIPGFVEQQRTKLRSSAVVDPSTSRVDLRYNPLSVDEDYFIPVRGQDSSTRIETLAGGQNTAAIEDVEYMQKKLVSALKIPRAYLGYEDSLSSKSTLSQLDIRFSRTINGIQKAIISELNKIAIIHLFAHGYSGEDLLDFSLRLTSPSTIAEQQKLELWRTKFEIAGTSPEGLVTKRFIRKNVLNLTDKEINDLDRETLEELEYSQKLEAMGAGEAEASGGGGGSSGGGGGGNIFGPPAEEATPEGGEGEEPTTNEPAPVEAGPEEIEDERNLELLTAADDHDRDDIELPKHPNMETPVKKPSQLKKSLYNQGRHRTHGASKTFMPDHAKMTGLGDRDDTLRDPFDKNSVLSYESVTRKNGVKDIGVHPRIDNNTKSMLEDMTQKWGKTKNSRGVMLVEGIDVQNEISYEDDDLGDLDIIDD